MIKYEGIKVQNYFHYVVFSNDKGKKVEVPIDERSAKMIALWLDKLSDADRHLTERGNDD